ncbi:MAG TPA: LPXTG cell wall anchor domain-containing protein [Acidimicrobiales bacterium]|nr:LPXTG cell wall anchor domain-containing protein [Acidimicrobiales bacterium]
MAPSTTTTSLAVAPVGQLPKTGSGSQTLLIVAGITLLLGGAALLGSAKLGQLRTA